MNKSEEGLVAVNEHGFFYRIKIFFRNLFFSNKDKVIDKEEKFDEITFSSSIKEKNSFVDDIKVQENKEYSRLLQLQKMFEMGRIKEKDLLQSDRIKLEKLYKSQIYQLNKSINEYKYKIIAVRKEIAKSSLN